MLKELKSKNTIIQGQVTQILLRELDMIYEQVGECELDISRCFFHSRRRPHCVDIGDKHTLNGYRLSNWNFGSQLFALKRLPIGIKRLKKELKKKNKKAAAVLDLYTQEIGSFILPRKHRNEVFMMTLWVLGIAASGLWSRILF